MPFSSSTSVPSARTRRVREKDKDNRSIISSSSGRRQSYRSKSGSRADSRPPDTASPVLYNQQNIALDQLPALPESGTESPSSTASSLHEPSPALRNSVHLIDPSNPPFTPEALRQYLDPDTDEPSFSGTDQDILATPTNNRSAYISSTEKPPDPETVDIVTTKLQDSAEAVSPKASSRAQTSQALGSNLGTSSNSPILKQPRPSHHIYPAYQGPYSSSLPYHGTFTNERYYSLPYNNPYYPTMNPQTPHHIDFNQQSMQPVFPGYGNQTQTQVPFSPLRSPPVSGHDLASSRASFSGETYGGTAATPMSSSRSYHPEMLDSCGPPGTIDDPESLLHRIQKTAIPDLHMLLDRYRATSSELEARGELMRKAEFAKTEALKQKETYIQKLGSELEHVSHKHSSESSKLRLEIGNLEEKQKELQERLLARKSSRDQLEAANIELQREKEVLQKRSEEEKAAMRNDHLQWKYKAQEEFAAKLKLSEGDSDRQIADRDAVTRDRIAEMERLHTGEKEALQASHGRQKREVEAEHARIRRDLENKLKARHRDFDDARQREHQIRESFQKERDDLFRGWDEERTRLSKGWEEQRRALTVQHQAEKDEMDSRWKVKQTQIGDVAEKENARLQAEIARLKAGWDSDKVKFEKAMAELKAAAARANEENANLQRTIEAFGDATDFRSKGDPYFIDAFTQLRKQILDLATEHFREAPDTQSYFQLQNLPPGLPSFVSNSAASYQLRAAYVQHIISRTLTLRVFQPFLFTIGRRHDTADQLLQNMSDKLKNKSIVREAVWRQHTLHAAYTVASAKQSINKIAAIIVEEILAELEPLTLPAQWEHIKVAVRRIVKVAAETWRYARLEREIITATMSVSENPAMFEPAHSSQIMTQGMVNGEPRQALLSLLPLIQRDRAHENAESNDVDQGCVYSKGVALFSDDSAVLARQAEIQQDDSQAFRPSSRASSSRQIHDNEATGRHAGTSTRALSPLTTPLSQVHRTTSIPFNLDEVVTSNNADGPSADLTDAQLDRNDAQAAGIALNGQRAESRASMKSQTPTRRSSVMTASDRRSSSTTTQSERVPKWGSNADGAGSNGGW